MCPLRAGAKAGEGGTMKGSKKERAMMRERRLRAPTGDAITDVSHEFVRQRPFFSHAGEPGSGDIDQGRFRSRGPKPDEEAEAEVSKVDRTSGSVGGDRLQGGVDYDRARMLLRGRGVYAEPRLGGESFEQLVAKVLIALKDKRRAGGKKGFEIEELRKLDAEIRQRSGVTDMSLGVPPGPGEISPRRARQAAAEALDSLSYTANPIPRKRRRMSMPGGGEITRKRARQCWQEQLRSSGIDF
jgi:hypothetical protein